MGVGQQEAERLQFLASSQALAWLWDGDLLGWLYIDLGLRATPKCDAGYVTMQNRAFNILPLPQLRNLLLDPAPYKLLVLAGPCLEETGELLLQTGGFSPRHFLQVLGDKEVSCLLPTWPPGALNPGSFLQ